MPVSEFHFAFCGIATVAATLGYACARRAVRSLASTPEPSKADVETGPPEERPLKRKLDDSDELDLDAEVVSRPMKRNRTPPVDPQDEDEDEWQVVVAPPSYEEAAGITQPQLSVLDHTTLPQGDSPSVERAVTPVREPTPPAYCSETSSQPEDKGAEAGRCSTPQPAQVCLSPNHPETPPPRPVTPPKPTVPAEITAFSAFSGSRSPFASYSNTSGSSPFASPARTAKTTPAWKPVNENESDRVSQSTSANILAPSPNKPSSTTTRSHALSQRDSVLGVSKETQSFIKSSIHLTGEEDEAVESELKGVKLFIKRGRKEFTDGIFGHIKILSQKSTPKSVGNEDPQITEAASNSRTRLLFRRDPLGQVSMNVGLRPTVRCHFDAAENILRVILMEPLTTDGQPPKDDVVVYALKPGRAPKADFQSFVKALCDHEGLGSGRVASSVDGADGDAAAS